ncbi:MAG: hypothetical protein KGK00_18225 [Paracoccaceae bacterium]|nr:hypothetical protein [Paracoccaceae bacterium]MDE3238441.1 hypothetical protein [Paracoccaceae bacterium]
MKKERRWLKSVIETSRQPMPALPWQRAVRASAPSAPRRIVAVPRGGMAAR